MDEQERIKVVYEKRSKMIKQDLYSYFNKGHLFIIQRRESELLDLLNKYGMNPLTEKRVLDVGCGKGEQLCSFIRCGARPENLFGIDLLPDRIEVAKKTIRP